MRTKKVRREISRLAKPDRFKPISYQLCQIANGFYANVRWICVMFSKVNHFIIIDYFKIPETKWANMYLSERVFREHLIR